MDRHFYNNTWGISIMKLQIIVIILLFLILISLIVLSSIIVKFGKEIIKIMGNTETRLQGILAAVKKSNEHTANVEQMFKEYRESHPETEDFADELDAIEAELGLSKTELPTNPESGDEEVAADVTETPASEETGTVTEDTTEEN